MIGDDTSNAWLHELRHDHTSTDALTEEDGGTFRRRSMKFPFSTIRRWSIRPREKIFGRR
jgi:hypothetical protein